MLLQGHQTTVDSLQLYSFCRPMLCKRGLCRHAVCVRLSVSSSICVCVCVCVTFVHSVKMNKHIFKIFSPSGSSLHTKRHGYIPMGTPLKRASNAGGVGRNRDFRPVSDFISCRQHCDRLGVIKGVFTATQLNSTELN